MALAAVLCLSACIGEAPQPSSSPVTTAAPDPSAVPILTEDPVTTVTPVVTPSVAPSASATPPRGDRTPEAMVVMAPEHPTRLLPPATNATERLLIDLLYDPLYRLDETMQPVPELARDLPLVSEDGLTWRVPIKGDARFHDGSKVTTEDVLFSLRMAASPSCPLGRELCAAVREHLAAPPQREEGEVIITLREPHAPFLAEALGRLPILSDEAVMAATNVLIDAAGRLSLDRPDTVVDEITEQMLREACADPEPPAGCRLVDHRERLERIFTRARLELPPELPYTDENGLFDEDAYVGQLLERLGALGQVFTTSDADKRSAALGLLDASIIPLGGGPYRLEAIDEEGTYHLVANRDHTRSTPRIEAISVDVERDPSVAVTRLVGGEADWVLEVGDGLEAAVTDVPDVRAGARPLDIQFGILFNVRPDRVYFDVATRRAFALCLDQAALAIRLDPNRAIATTPYTATSWAQPEASPEPRDVAAATALLDQAGWLAGADGVRVRDGKRLSTTIAVRPTSVDLFTFANEAAEQLAGCGIELVVEELDLTGDTMLDQLLWPNDFDTLLLARTLGPDPDSAVRFFESSRITTAENQADANPSGFTSSLVDHLVSSARASLDPALRSEAYAGVQDVIRDDVPYWPLWYASAVSAISTRIQGPDGPLDPTASRYDWDVSSWRLVEAEG
jgi:ABC-type transport system substrate-binding protein